MKIIVGWSQVWSFTWHVFVVVVQLGGLSDRVRGHRTDSMSPSAVDQQQDTVDQLELQFYETQLDLYDTKFEILKNEEQLLVAQIDSLRRQIKGRIHMTGSAAVNMWRIFWFMEGDFKHFKMVKTLLEKNWFTVDECDVLVQSTVKHWSREKRLEVGSHPEDLKAAAQNATSAWMYDIIAFKLIQR